MDCTFVCNKHAVLWVTLSRTTSWYAAIANAYIIKQLTDSVSVWFLWDGKNFPLNSTQVVGVLFASLHSKPVDLNLNLLVDLMFAAISLAKIKHSLYNWWVNVVKKSPNCHNKQKKLHSFVLGGLRIPQS